MKNVIESIEEDQKHNNTRKMYQTVNHTHTHTHTHRYRHTYVHTVLVKHVSNVSFIKIGAC